MRARPGHAWSIIPALTLRAARMQQFGARLAWIVGTSPTHTRAGHLPGPRRLLRECLSMDREDDIAALRSRVSALVEQESGLLNQAFELSRAGGDRRGVDALLAQVQAIQVQRSVLKKQIGEVLGSQRLHMASEVWRPGTYSYRPAVGGDSVRVRVTKEALGLHVAIPGRREPVRIETLEGTFDGPLAVDDAAAHQDATPAQKTDPRGRQSKKKSV